MDLVETRTCPVCGAAERWAFGLVWHRIEGAKYVHLKMRNEFKAGQIHVMASILRNGVRYLAA